MDAARSWNSACSPQTGAPAQGSDWVTITVRVSEVMTCTQENLVAWSQNCGLQEASCRHKGLRHLSEPVTAWLLPMECCRDSPNQTDVRACICVTVVQWGASERLPCQLRRSEAPQV